MYGKLYSMCGYSQQADTSNTHFLVSNDSNYYAPEQFYEDAMHIKTANLKYPGELKFGEQGINELNPFVQDEQTHKKCKSCTSGTRESYIRIPSEQKTPMLGAKKYKSGSKTVVNCTSCYSGEGKHAIPVTSVDSSDIRLVNEIYNNPGSCNNPTNTLKNPSDTFTSDYGWGKSRWNKIKENYEEKSGLDKQIWGSSGWRLIHAATFVYPENPSLEKQFAMWNFLHSLHEILPCLTCNKECAEYVLKNPPPVDNHKHLRYWAWKFHDTVNKRLNKKGWTWEQTKKYYKTPGNVCSS